MTQQHKDNRQYIKKIRSTFPDSNYMFQVNNRNTKTRFKKCSKLTIKTPERRH